MKLKVIIDNKWVLKVDQIRSNKCGKHIQQVIYFDVLDRWHLSQKCSLLKVRGQDGFLRS